MKVMVFRVTSGKTVFILMTWKQAQILICASLLHFKHVCKVTKVKPALSDHPTVQEKVVVIDRWSRKQGSLNSGRFFEALLNSDERRGTHVYDLRNDKSRQPGASGGLVWWFSCKLALWWLFKERMWVKATIFLAFGRLRQGKSGRWCKNPGRWWRYAGGRLIQVILNGRLSVHKNSVAKSRWSLKPVVAYGRFYIIQYAPHQCLMTSEGVNSTYSQTCPCDHLTKATTWKLRARNFSPFNLWIQMYECVLEIATTREMWTTDTGGRPKVSI